MSVNRDSFIKYLDTFLLGKINEEHLVCELNIREDSTNILYRPVHNQHFKVDTTYNHKIIDGFTGEIILNNTHEIRNVLSIMDKEVKFSLEYNNITKMPYLLVLEDSKRKIKFTLGIKSESAESINERSIKTMPEPAQTVIITKEFISQFSKLHNIFKPDTVSLLNNDTDTANILRFNSDNSIGEVELVLDTDFVDLERKNRKSDKENTFHSTYFLKILETNKDITDKLELNNIISYQGDDIPMSCLYFNFESADIHSKYILLPYIKI